MSILKILTYPHDVLAGKSKKVTDFGPKTQKLIDDMIETMYSDDGVGLAAPQVGQPLAILIASPTMTPGEEYVICNPEIVESKGSERGPEGCLSFPGVFTQVERATYIKLRYQNRKGQEVLQDMSDFFARIVQHEMDHLTGTLLIDRVGFDERQQLLSEYQKQS